jgi:glutamine cyclotransferase
MLKTGRGAFLAVLACLGWIGLEAWRTSIAATCGVPAALHYHVLNQIVRSSPGFTEGLVYRDGSLYESTGGYGDSRVQRIHLDTGKVDQLARLPQDQFGEGLEMAGDSLFQLTWKEHQVNQWDTNGRLKHSNPYPYEGWGLTRDSDGHWISSDGSESLYFFNQPPDATSNSAWLANSRLSVLNGARAETRLNELEFARGSVFADIFQQNRIVRIDPASGCVTGDMNLDALVAGAGVNLSQNPDHVLNGIAYRPETDTFFITGKDWPAIYEVQIISGGD